MFPSSWGVSAQHSLGGHGMSLVTLGEEWSAPTICKKNPNMGCFFSVIALNCSILICEEFQSGLFNVRGHYMKTSALLALARRAVSDVPVTGGAKDRTHKHYLHFGRRHKRWREQFKKEPRPTTRSAVRHRDTAFTYTFSLCFSPWRSGELGPRGGKSRSTFKLEADITVTVFISCLSTEDREKYEEGKEQRDESLELVL